MPLTNEDENVVLTTKIRWQV